MISTPALSCSRGGRAPFSTSFLGRLVAVLAAATKGARHQRVAGCSHCGHEALLLLLHSWLSPWTLRTSAYSAAQRGTEEMDDREASEQFGKLADEAGLDLSYSSFARAFQRPHTAWHSRNRSRLSAPYSATCARHVGTSSDWCLAKERCWCGGVALLVRNQLSLGGWTDGQLACSLLVFQVMTMELCLSVFWLVCSSSWMAQQSPCAGQGLTECKLYFFFFANARRLAMATMATRFGDGA